MWMPRTGGPQKIIMLPYLFLFLQLAFAFFFFYLCLAFVTGAPFVPSTDPVSKGMIRLAHIKKGQTVYDLGSGNGKLLFLAAQKGAKAKGLEINPFLVLYANIRSFFSHYRNTVHTYWKDFWSAPLSDADVVFIYLLPWRMEKLEKNLQKKLKKGTLIVSNSFIFPHLTCVEKDESLHIFSFKI
jgi:SAM-dependent methyltransferase